MWRFMGIDMYIYACMSCIGRERAGRVLKMSYIQFDLLTIFQIVTSISDVSVLSVPES
jgi:hypothetical protein